MIQLHVITACARPQLLHGLISSIQYSTPHRFDLQHHIFYKGIFKDPGACTGINELLDRIPKTADNWMIPMCDDNFFHVDFLSKASATIELNPLIKAIVYGQKRNDNSKGFIVADPKAVRPGYIDGAQAIVRMDLVGDTRYNKSPKSDGEFLVELYRKEPHSFLFINDPVTYFEAAFWFMSGGGEKGDRYLHESVIASMLRGKLSEPIQTGDENV